MARLEVNEVSKSFVGRTGSKHVLNRLSLHADEGEFVSIIGPSGSGKSTLFHIIGGIVQPDEGTIVLGGRAITGQRGNVSYMPQHNTLLPWRTVLDNATMPLEIAGGTSKREAREQAREWLAKVGLSDYEREYPHVLSGGMQQRVAFARALISPQQVMCLDEPFGALDALTRMEMQRWLLGIWEQYRRTVLFITHSIEEALLLSDRVYVLSDKPARVVAELRMPFARPRDNNVMKLPAFIELRSEVYSLIEGGAAGGSPSR